MAATLHITLFGNPSVSLAGKPVSGFVSSKASALVYYVAATDRPHARDSLATLLWADVPQAQARKNLRDVLSNLRRLLGSHLEITRQSVGVSREAVIQVDSLHLEERIKAAQNESASSPVRTQLLHQAASLYRGEFLEGFYVPQAPIFEEWVLNNRERYIQLAQQTLDALVVECTHRGTYLVGIDYATRLLTLNPLDEKTHRRLMSLLAADGQHAAALAQYESCCQILHDELGAEPALETNELFERIQSAQNRPSHNLPGNEQWTAFVGRERELSEINHLLADPACRLLTIVGLGGVGKTRLALQVAESNLSRYLDGVYFVSLSSLSKGEFLASAIAESIGTIFSGAESVDTQLVNFLRGKEMLLVLDNFEHLLGDLDLLANILRNALGIHLLVTSRERLNLRAEWLIEIEGLQNPPVDQFMSGSESNDAGTKGTNGNLLSQQHLQQYDSIRLFLQSARQVRPDFIPHNQSSANAELLAMVRVCRLVGGMPLAIELAASWTQTLSCEEIAAEIERSVGFLETSQHDVPVRHRSLNAVFDHSWRLLNAEERHILQMLAIFRGGFRREAAQEVTGASLHQLSTLTYKSFLRRDSEGQYTIHELLRQYVQESHAEDLVMISDTKDRHCLYYTELLRRYQAQLTNIQDSEAIDEIASEIENIRIAWRWAVSNQKIYETDQALQSLYLFFSTRHWFEEGESTFALAARDFGKLAVTNLESDRLLGRVQAREAQFARNLGHHHRAKRLMIASLERAQKYDDVSESAFCLAALADVSISQADYGEARTYSERSHALFSQMDDAPGSAHALHSLSDIALRTGNYPEAEKFVEQALDLAQVAGLRQIEADSLRTLGQLYWNKGDYAAAAADYTRAVEIYRKPHVANRQGEASALNALGFVAWSQENYDTAGQHYAQALRIFREIGDRNGEATSLDKLGEVAEKQRNYPTAWRYYKEALELGREMGDRQLTGATLMNLGFLTYHQGDYAGSQSYFEQALKIHRQIGFRRFEGLDLACLGLLSHLNQRDEQARELCRQALLVTEDLGDRPIQGYALTHLGHALTGLNELDEAHNSYFEAFILRREMGDHDRAMEPLAGMAFIALKQNKIEKAQAQVAQILDFLDGEHGSFDRTLMPLQIYFTCYQVLSAVQDPRSYSLLETAHTAMQERAQVLDNEQKKHIFLNEIAVHHDIATAYAATSTKL